MTAAMAAPFAPDSLTPPDQRRWSGPLLLALVAHALLVAALTWGISWNKATPNVVAQAELWSAMPRTAAPRLVEEAPEPPPPPPPEPPTPARPPAPPAPTQPAPDPVAEQREADIALAQKKKREQEQREQAEAARLKAEKAAQEKAEKTERAEKERQARLKLEREKSEREKAERDKAEREAKAKEDAQKLARQKAAQKAEQQKTEQAKADANKKAQQAELARQRAENLKRMAGMAGATGGPGSTGSDTHSSGPSAGYAGRIVGAVRPNIVFTDTPPGNPAADVEVRTLPDGTIASRRIVKSSGMPAWDDAVLKALDRTAKLPRDTDGRVPGTLLITFRLRD